MITVIFVTQYWVTYKYYIKMHKICLQLHIILLPKYNFHLDSGLIFQINGKIIVPLEIGLNDFKAENI